MNNTLRGMAVVVLFTILLLPAFGNPAPRYIDIDAAEAEISVLETEKSSLAVNSQDRETAIEQINRDITVRFSEITDINGLLDRLSVSGGELYRLKVTNVDQEKGRRIDARMRENREQRHVLELRKATLIGEIETLRTRREEHRKIIAANSRRSGEIDSRAAWLQSSVAYTNEYNPSLDEAFSNADEIKRDVNALLGS